LDNFVIVCMINVTEPILHNASKLQSCLPDSAHFGIKSDFPDVSYMLPILYTEPVVAEAIEYQRAL
jgi:hypothetical protein